MIISLALIKKKKVILYGLSQMGGLPSLLVLLVT
jgi:hypothetical protein